MNVDHEFGKVLLQLLQSQDDEIGDGSTGVDVLEGALFEQASALLDRGINLIRIADRYELACQKSVKHLEFIANMFPFSTYNLEPLIQVAMTTLGLKVVNKCHRQMATIAVQTVIAVANLETRDINFKLIKVEVKGVVIDKAMSHSQTLKELHDVKLAILTCSFEPPKLKTKNKLDVTSVEYYKEFRKYEHDKFVEMVTCVKSAGATLAICQWV